MTKSEIRKERDSQNYMFRWASEKAVANIIKNADKEVLDSVTELYGSSFITTPFSDWSDYDHENMTFLVWILDLTNQE